MEQVYSCVIIGCGEISGLNVSKSETAIISHAQAIDADRRLRLSGVYDINPETASIFAEKWNTEYFESIEYLFAKCNPEIVIIASKSETHLEILNDCLDYNPKSVICEKPIGNDIEAAKEIIANYQSRNIPITINYLRLLDSSVQNLKKQIQENKFGNVINVSAYYTRGILNNGSHLFSLLTNLFDEIESFQIMNSTLDYTKGDPTLDLYAVFKNGGKCQVIGGNENSYSIFEIDILFEKKRITFKNFGNNLIISDVLLDPNYSGKYMLGKEENKETDFINSFSALYSNVINNIEKNQKLISPASEAIKSEEFIHKILNKYNSKYE